MSSNLDKCSDICENNNTTESTKQQHEISNISSVAILNIIDDKEFKAGFIKVGDPRINNKNIRKQIIFPDKVAECAEGFIKSHQFITLKQLTDKVWYFIHSSNIYFELYRYYNELYPNLSIEEMNQKVLGRCPMICEMIEQICKNELNKANDARNKV